MKHLCICSGITQDQDFARALCNSRAALSCRESGTEPSPFCSTNCKPVTRQLNIQPRYVLRMFEYISQTFALPESIRLSDTQGCEKPSRNKPKYANPIKLEFTGLPTASSPQRGVCFICLAVRRQLLVADLIEGFPAAFQPLKRCFWDIEFAVLKI